MNKYRVHAETRSRSIKLVPALLASALIVAGIAWSARSHAATASTTFTVSATVANFCTVSAGNVAFGSVNAGAAATNTASNVTLTCNKGVTVSSVALNDGSNASGTQKRMTNGTDTLNYRIERPAGALFDTCPAAGGGTEWNATNTIAATSLFATTGGAKLLKICASIPAAQFPSGGAYSDTVTVTVTYS